MKPKVKAVIALAAFVFVAFLAIVIGNIVPFLWTVHGKMNSYAIHVDQYWGSVLGIGILNKSDMRPFMVLFSINFHIVKNNPS